MTTRREFIRQTTGGLATLAALGPLFLMKPKATAAIRKAVMFHRGKQGRLPVLAVARGSHADVGRAVGANLGMEIQGVLHDRKLWWEELLQIAATPDGKVLLDECRKAAEKHAAPALEELLAYSKHSGVSAQHLFILNCKNELDALSQQQKGCPGCSTAVLATDQRLLVVHNEDGDKAYDGRMFLLDAAPDGGSRFVSHTYPGIVTGNASWLNEHGVFMSTNYIPSAIVKPGIPRYLLYRMAVEAPNVEKAIDAVTHEKRAYAGHHIIGSLVTRKVFSVEVTPEKKVVKPVKGLFWHTNHLVHEGIRDEPQFTTYMKSSSIPRYDSVTRSLSGRHPDKTTLEDLLKAVSNHDGKPTPVCRHAPGDVRGITVGTAIFESTEPDHAVSPFVVRYINGRPCQGEPQPYPVG